MLVDPGPLDAEALGDERSVDHRSAMAALSGLGKELHRATRDTFDVMVAQGPERDLTAYDLRRSAPSTLHGHRPAGVSIARLAADCSERAWMGEVTVGVP